MSWPITDFSTSPPYQQIFDYTGSIDGIQPIYIGWAAPGAATTDAKWLIRRFTYDGSNRVSQIQFATGAFKFMSRWDQRAALNYG